MTPEQDPFASVRAETFNKGPTLPPKEELSKGDPFYNVRAPNPADFESGDEIDREVERHIASLTSRGIEQVVGFPGNMVSFANMVSDLYHSDPIFGKLKAKEKQPESFKPNAKDPQQLAFPTIGMVGNLIDWFPTSSEVKQGIGKATGGYTNEPEDPYGKMGHEIFENVIASSLPGTGQRTLYKNVAIPVGAYLAKQGAKYFDFAEDTQSGVQFATSLVMNMMNRANAPRYNREQWQQVQNNAPAASITPAQNSRLLIQAQHLEHQLTEGLGSNSESSALKAVRAFIEKLDRPQGTINARELVASNRSLNEIAGDPELLERGRTLLNGLRRTINNGLDHIGQQHPDWLQQYRNANQIHGAIQNSNYVSNFVRDNYAKPLVSPAVKSLFAAGASPIPLAVTAAASGPIFAIYKGVQTINRMAQSPILQRYYTNAIIASLRGEVGVMTSNLDKLDKAFQEEEKKKKKPPFQ